MAQHSPVLHPLPGLLSIEGCPFRMSSPPGQKAQRCTRGSYLTRLGLQWSLEVALRGWGSLRSLCWEPRVKVLAELGPHPLQCRPRRHLSHRVGLQAWHGRHTLTPAPGLRIPLSTRHPRLPAASTEAFSPADSEVGERVGGRPWDPGCRLTGQ